MVSNLFPLFSAQKRIWYFKELSPSSAVYNIPFVVKINGKLNAGVLKNTINALVDRHETLRTAFFSIEGKPVQLIREQYVVHIDQRSFEKAYNQDDIEIAHLIRNEITQPIDLKNGLPFRLKLLNFPHSEHVLIFSFHHIIFDGWSLGVFFKEFSQLYVSKMYEQKVLGEPTVKPTLQYIDYVRWQETWLRSDDAITQLEYWKNKLSGYKDLVGFPKNVSANIKANVFAKGHLIHFNIDAKMLHSLKLLTAQTSASLFTVLLSAFKVLLYKYSAQEDMIVGIPVANRQKQELENMIGFFVNTLAIRTSLSGDPTFKTLLTNVHETVLDAYLHQDIPYDKVVEVLNPTRNGIQSSYFNTLFVLQNMPLSRLDLPELSIESLPYSTDTAKFDLSMTLFEREEMISAAVEYNTAVYDKDYIQQIITHYLNILQVIGTDPEKKLSAIDIYSRSGKARPNDSQNHAFSLVPVHIRFTRQAKLTPEKIVIHHNNKTISYSELDKLSNRIAKVLFDKGTTSNSIVGICMNRNIEMMISLLAILKAGGAYLPLDPAYPKERTRFTIQDADVNLILSESKLKDLLTDQDAEILLVDELLKINDPPEDTFDIHTTIQIHDLAYVIYTSGSTGKPKGVAIEHISLCNLLSWGKEYFKQKFSLQKNMFLKTT